MRLDAHENRFMYVWLHINRTEQNSKITNNKVYKNSFDLIHLNFI